MPPNIMAATAETVEDGGRGTEVQMSDAKNTERIERSSQN